MLVVSNVVGTLESAEVANGMPTGVTTNMTLKGYNRMTRALQNRDGAADTGGFPEWRSAWPFQAVTLSGKARFLHRRYPGGVDSLYQGREFRDAVAQQRAGSLQPVECVDAEELL